MENMTVRDCIKMYRHKNYDRFNRVWLCPQIVHNPKVGNEYTLECNINSKLGEKLSNSIVTKHWAEGPCVCIAYKLEVDTLTDISTLLESKESD